MGDNPCSEPGLKASGWLWPGEEVGRLKASWTDDMVFLEFLLFFGDEELNKFVNQLI